MANNTLTTRLVICNDTSAKWGSSDKVLLKGEFAIEFPTDGEPKIKVGNGIDIFADLPYVTNTPTEITTAINVAVKAASHTHENKTILDAITAAFTTELKNKLDGIAVGAEVNQNAFSKVTVGTTTVQAGTKTDTITLEGSNINITPDVTNKKITIAIANGSTSGKGVVQLTDSTSSTSTTTAATPNSVKSAYDLANTAKTAAATAQNVADSKVKTVSLASGTNNGTLKLTVDGTTTDNVAVKGLGTAAYTPSSAYATSAQGTKADNAMPKSGGTFTGAVTLSGDPTANLHPASKQYVDFQITSKIAASDAMVFKGTLGTGGTITALPTTGVVKGDTYKVITAGTYAGSTCKVGDLVIALNSGSVEATATNWAYVPSGNENETYIKYSTTTQSLTTTAQSGTITLAEGATKQVDTSVSSGTTSTKLPTSAAVASFVDGKISGVNTTINNHKNDTTAHITADERTKWNFAEANQNAFSKITVGAASIEADAKTDTLTLEAGSNVQIGVDAENDKLTISATNTTYSAGTGISLSGTTINHKNSVTAGTASGDASKTLTFGGTFTVPSVTYDTQGHITGKGSTTMTMPATPTTVSGNAGSSTKLQTARTIDGVSFNGTANIVHYGTCSTAAATQEKAVAITGFTLTTGARLLVKFTTTNTVSSPTLNVNSTGAKAIFYRGSAISIGLLAEKRVYEFVYDGTNYELVGDINTDTNTDTKVTNTLATTTKAYITGTTSATTNTGTQVFDTGVYLDTTAGTLVANTFKGTLSGKATSASNADTATKATSADTSITATTATKLGTDAGSTTRPVYFSNGVPVETNVSTDYLVQGIGFLILDGGDAGDVATYIENNNGNVKISSVTNSTVTDSDGETQLEGNSISVTDDDNGNVVLNI